MKQKRRQPLGINKDNESDYMYRARQVFEELQHRFKTQIESGEADDAPVLVRGGGNVADHIWNIVWPGGSELWGVSYETNIPGTYVYSFNKTSAIIHMENADAVELSEYKFEEIKVNI